MQLTSQAKNKILALGKERIFIQFYEGGCAGYRYRFSFAPPATESHCAFEVDGIMIFLTGVGSEKITNIVIDYESSLMGSRFFLKEIDGIFCKCQASVRPVKNPA